MLGAAEERPYRRGIQIERGGKLVVAEAVVPEEEQFGLARPNDREDQADSLPLLGGSAQLLGCWRLAEESKKAFVPGAAVAAAQFIQALANGGAREPGFGMIVLEMRHPPQFEKHFDGELFGARGVVDDPGDDAGDAAVLSAEEGFELGARLPGRHLANHFGLCVHIVITPGSRKL
jgi:hypothetical protein